MAKLEIEYDTDQLLKNDNEIDRLRKEIDELKYQIDREKREGERLKQILAGGTGLFNILIYIIIVYTKRMFVNISL